jgi:hypothetical protein
MAISHQHGAPEKREGGNTRPISHVFVTTTADCILKTGKGAVDPAAV